ncbi:MAG: capsule assembly Wzi family protein [Gammaproteobacteria bacterium]|nr:MAG: capsule assembly Wzi family protein [Gammaproteobacteria bacterium]
MKTTIFRWGIGPLSVLCPALAALVWAGATLAGPYLAPGNMALRSDLQVLADGGHLSAPITTWPLSWGDIAASLDDSGADWRPEEIVALVRLRRHIDAQTVSGIPTFTAYGSGAANPQQIRSFEATPREDGELGVGFTYTGAWWATSLQGQWVSDPEDGDEWRADGSYIGVALGNWMVSAAITDRWWGPGWQSSLILSSNARPIPAISLERNSTQAFETKWLSWLGPWDLTVMWGQLESDREIPDANLFGMRFNFKPFKSLEIGLSRTAQLCGDGRPCGLDTIFNMLIGRDNRGDNISAEDEPGNQLAGFDVRWSSRVFDQPFALYTQWIGEDEDGFFPTQWLGQFGGETWGQWDALGTYRLFLEWSDTECNFRFYDSVRNDGDRSPGCAYNHPIYQSGYRFKQRAIGHSFDGDSSVFTLGTTLTDNADHTWIATVAIGNLNRRSARPSTTAEHKTRYREVQVVHRRPLWIGDVGVGLGYDYRKDTVTHVKDDEFRVFLEWGMNY